MSDLLLSIGVICNSISIIILCFHVRSIRKERFSISDLRRVNRIQQYFEDLHS